MASQGNMNLQGAITYISEPRKTHKGKTVVNLSIVIEKDKYNDETKQWERAGDEDKTYWSATAFGRLADNLLASAKPGDRVVGNGDVQPKPTYTDRNGVEHKNEAQIILRALGPDWNMWPTTVNKNGSANSPSAATHESAAPAAASAPKVQTKVDDAFSGSEFDDPFGEEDNTWSN